MDSDSSQLIILFVCIILSGFFSGAETALTSLDNIKLRTMINEGMKNARLTEKVLQDPSKLISAILIGNNLVNIGASSIATLYATRHFGSSGAGIATGVLTFIILVFGEITPKTFAKENNVKLSLFVVKPIYLCMIIFTPIIFVLNIITGAILSLITKNKKQNTGLTESEFRTIVDVGHEEGILESEEKKMITNVVDFGDSDAKEVMVPRIDMVSVPVTSTLEEVVSVFKKYKFTRLPVYSETNDHIVGVISFKDIMLLSNNDDFKIEDYMKEPYFTYESKPLSSLFSSMKKEKVTMAIVLDEYGGTAGIVTLQDLIEEIVGDIIDEVREDTDDIIPTSGNSYIAKGSARLDDVNELLNTHFEYEDMDSIGGYIIGKLGRYPRVGEKIKDEEAVFIIIETGYNRVEALKIIPLNVQKGEKER